MSFSYFAKYIEKPKFGLLRFSRSRPDSESGFEFLYRTVRKYNKKDVVIIGGGLSGLECLSTLINNGYTSVVLLEKSHSVIRKNSWKTFKQAVDDFDLRDCTFNGINKIHFRTVNIDSSGVMYESLQSNECYVLDSEKIYQKYADALENYIRCDAEVIGIEKIGKKYRVATAENSFDCDIIVDASGNNSIVDQCIPSNFVQSAFYTCYAKRFTQCDASLMRHDAFFDFDSPFKACGCWCYPIDDTTIEIGIGRFSNTRELADPQKVDEIEGLLTKYMKLAPFNDAFKDAKPVETISGYCALLPRQNIYHDNIYHIGDAKGAIPYSGYGVENALRSGKRCAESIIHWKNYKFYITPTARGYAILHVLWHLTEEELVRVATGIAEMNDAETLQFYTGNIDLKFLIKSQKINHRRKIDMFGRIPKKVLIKALFNMKLSSRDYQLNAPSI